MHVADPVPTPPRFLRVLKGESFATPPVWFMRQAGRYLPEYRATRAKAGSFLELCYHPELAAEVTLQPIERYDLDAAILFADILLIPQALGQSLTFGEGEGPKLSPPVTARDLGRFLKADIHATLSPVYETVRLTRAGLSTDKALIGFAGAPWTVATYMLAGGALREPAELRRILYEDPAFMRDLIALICDATVDYLVRQIDAGADAVQLFDTWAGGLPEAALVKLSIEPMRDISVRVKAKRPGVPVIVFPKGVGAMAAAYAELDAADGLGIDFSMPWEWARKHLSPHIAVQGGLDPMLVVSGGPEMENAARRLKRTFAGAPYIFNLGHGFTPDTPPDHVKRLVEIVREEA